MFGLRGLGGERGWPSRASGWCQKARCSVSKLWTADGLRQLGKVVVEGGTRVSGRVRVCN